jgi:hypothetical protein
MRHRWVYIAYAVLGACLWPLPLLNVLHVESSAVVAAAAFFISGGAACGLFSPWSTLREWTRVTGRLLRALVVPWAMLTVSVLWAPNCGYLQGLGLFLLFAPLSAVLGTAVAYALTGIGAASSTDTTGSADAKAFTGLQNDNRSRPARRGWLVGVGVAVIIGGLVFDYAFHPQFFSYNHIFGGILGPIYDEQLAIRPGLFWFRGMTVLWILVLVAAGTRLRGRGPRWTRAVLPVAALLLGAGYFFSTSLGFNVTEASLKQALPGTLRTDHFEIHYQPRAHSPEEVAAWGRMQERAYADLSERLSADPARHQRFLTFVYPSPEAKAMLTGARTTSVAPVWLGRAQSHLLVSRLEASFQHELAHLFSRPYGLPGLNASWSVGLVEGWAVALEPPSLAPSLDDLVRAARGRTGLGDDLTEAVEARLSPLGFWTDRGAVSYTTMGSFVSYLLETYGAEPLKKVYALADFETVYGRSLAELTAEWAASLESDDTVHASAGRSADRQFSRLSLFETECPHYVPPYRRRLQEGSRLLSDGDTTAARSAFRTALTLEPRSATAHVELARIRLSRGEPDAVLRQLDSLDGAWTTPSVDIVRADAHARRGQVDAARVLYRSTRSAWPDHAAELQTELLLRSISSAHGSLVNVWTSRAPAKTQAERFWEQAEEEGTASGMLATVWAARRWAEADHPRKAATAWRLARETAKRNLGEERRGTGPMPRILREAHGVVQNLLSSVTAGTSLADQDVAGLSTNGTGTWPRGWRIRLAAHLAQEMFVAEMEAVSSGEAAGEVQGGAAPAAEPMSRAALANEANVVADHMQARGAEQHARMWRHLAETARRAFADPSVAALTSPLRDEFGSFGGYR